MASTTPQMITLQLDPGLFTRLKVYAVAHSMDYSRAIAAAVHQIVHATDRPTDLAGFKKRYHDTGVAELATAGRGRPTAAFLKDHGPILRKKATFRLPPRIIRGIRTYAVNTLRLDRSSFVNMAIKIFLDSNG